MCSSSTVLVPEQYKTQLETPQAGLWEPTTPKERRAVDLGVLEKYAPRIAQCGSTWRHGYHQTPNGPHVHSENHSRCAGYGCESCTKARAVRLTALYGQLAPDFPAHAKMCRIDVKAPLALGPSSGFDKRNLTKYQDKVQNIRRSVLQGLDGLPTYFSMLHFWGYEDGFLHFSVLSVYGSNLYPDDATEAIDKALNTSEQVDMEILEFPRGQFPNMLLTTLGRRPESAKGISGIEVQALFYQFHRTEFWGHLVDKLRESDCVDCSQPIEESVVAAENSEFPEVCRDASTNLDPAPMKCWCGALCTHVMFGPQEPPKVEELLKNPAPPG